MAVSWRPFIQGTFGIAVTVAVLVICFAYFAVGIATRSHPDAYATSTVGVGDTLRIYRNSFGIPHVVGASDRDAVFGQGWVHAQDRLWQMDLLRRTGQGRLSELFGKSCASTDAFLRSLDLVALVRSQHKNLPPQSREFLASYTAGINAFLKNNGEALAFEFDALGYHPEPWAPEDCLLVSKVLALQQSPALITDMVYAQIARQRGVAATRMYVPSAPGAPYALDTSNAPPTVDVPEPPTDSSIAAIGKAIQEMGATLSGLRMYTSVPSGAHSNAWAVGRGDDHAILANDPHLAVSMPALWYQVHLTSPTMNVVGLSIPGIPFVLSGRTDSLAWGITSAMLDDLDYRVINVAPDNSNYYLIGKGERAKFRYRRDTIRIKDAPDSLIDLRFTSVGCVVSGLNTACFTIQWTGGKFADEVGALYLFNTALTVDAMRRGALLWGAPGLVMQIAHMNGSVASIGAGLVPVRTRVDALLPSNAFDSTRGWNGMMRLADFPGILRQRRGYVASANNGLMPAQAPSQSVYFEPSSRIDRIMGQLLVYREMTARDAQVLQQDVGSVYSARLNKKLVPILKRARTRYSTEEKAALELLEKWDGSMTPVDSAASIHAVLLQRLMWNTFEDELGTPLFKQWLTSRCILCSTIFARRPARTSRGS
jgi:penicillin amidase